MASRNTLGLGALALISVVTVLLLVTDAQKQAQAIKGSCATSSRKVPGAALEGLVYHSDLPMWDHVSRLTNNKPQSFVLHRDRVAGNVFLPPVHASWILNAERHVLATFDNLDCSRPGTLVVDVGANDGIFSLLAAKRGCRTVAFELQHLCIEFLQAAHNINAAPATVVVQRPVMDRSGTPFSLPTHDSCSGGFDVNNGQVGAR